MDVIMSTRKNCRIALLVFMIIGGAATAFAQEPGSNAPGGFTDWFSRWQPENRWLVGIYGGYSRNTLFTGGAEQVMYFTANEPGNGWTIGLPVRFNIFTWLAVQAEATFITKNYTIRQTCNVGREFDLYDSHINSFVNFPLMLHFRVRVMESPLSLFANAGGYMGVWAASRRQGRVWSLTTTDGVHSYNERRTFDNRFDNRFDAGLLFGMGAQYDFRAISIFAEWRYNYGLTDLRKNMQRNQIPNINDTWTIHAGVLLNANTLNALRRQQ